MLKLRQTEKSDKNCLLSMRLNHCQAPPPVQNEDGEDQEPPEVGSLLVDMSLDALKRMLHSTREMWFLSSIVDL